MFLHPSHKSSISTASKKLHLSNIKAVCDPGDSFTSLKRPAALPEQNNATLSHHLSTCDVLHVETPSVCANGLCDDIFWIWDFGYLFFKMFAFLSTVRMCGTLDPHMDRLGSRSDLPCVYQLSVTYRIDCMTYSECIWLKILRKVSAWSEPLWLSEKWVEVYLQRIGKPLDLSLANIVCMLLVMITLQD